MWQSKYPYLIYHDGLINNSNLSWNLESHKKAVEKIPGGPYQNLEARSFKNTKNSEWNGFEY
jgi:NAD(P)H-quinone oxidoreductase subunit H